MNIGRFSVLDFLIASSNVIHFTLPSAGVSVNFKAVRDRKRATDPRMSSTFFMIKKFHLSDSTTKLKRKEVQWPLIFSIKARVTFLKIAVNSCTKVKVHCSGVNIQAAEYSFLS